MMLMMVIVIAMMMGVKMMSVTTKRIIVFTAVKALTASAHQWYISEGSITFNRKS